MRIGMFVAVTALQLGVPRHVHGQRVESGWSSAQLRGVRDESTLLISLEIPRECIGAAATQGIIVSVGGFLVYKIMSGLPLFGAPPSARASDGAAIVVFVVAGAAYAVWRAKRCESENALRHPAVAPPTASSASSIGPSRVGFSRRDRLYPGLAPLSPSLTGAFATSTLPRF